MKHVDTRSRLEALLRSRIAVLDGAWGVLLQGRGLSEEEFRGERFGGHDHDLKGDPDLLNITQPQIVAGVHDAYFAAGADIATTNTFTATSFGQRDYGLEDAVADMNLAGAMLAREAADRAGGERFVAGSVGPLNVTLSLSPKVDDPGFRAVTFDDVVEAYAQQMRALRDGGVDLLLIETIFDTLNAKAAVAAAKDAAPDLPLWISVTIVDRSGRTLSGQTVEAFWTSIEHAEPVIVGINCSLGAAEMRPYVETFSRIADTPVACYPNAGLPNAFGGYDESPEVTSGLLREFAEARLVNLVGGCCGTTPDHTVAIAAAVRDLEPRAVPSFDDRVPTYSGLERFAIRRDTGFVMIGERQNVTGSATFRRMIESGDYEAAVDVALDQVRSGANMLDVNMDADLLDGEGAMSRFLSMIAVEPEIARVPVMVDSSRWETIVAGLKCVQGKGVVNSISLKEGEADFLEKARAIKAYGAAVVVMCFDEQGQAGTVERKVEIADRSIRLLVEEAGLRADRHHHRPQHPRDRDRPRRARGLREGVHRGDPRDQARPPRRAGLRRRVEPELLVPRQRARAAGDPLGVPVPRDRGRARHGDRERGPARGVRGHPEGPARARRGHHLQPARRRDGAHGHVRRHGQGWRTRPRGRPHLA